MAGLGPTIFDLVRYRSRLQRLKAGAPGSPPTLDASLKPIRDFGSNPGALRMFTYRPWTVRANGQGAALVVVLHGCRQSAAGFARDAGWTSLAERNGFILLCPEQSTANNGEACFNWFQPGDSRRDRGEVMSIRQMIDRVEADHAIDPDRVFVTGLSAGGAMATALLAAYPGRFAGAGIVAGLPFGAADSVSEALQAMFDGRSRTAGDWGDAVRLGSAHSGHWPRLSIWHGEADKVVVPGNADELVKQWTHLHGLHANPDRTHSSGPMRRETWTGRWGRTVIERVSIAGMGHGMPIGPSVDGTGGQAGPYMLDVGVSAAEEMVRFWGLARKS